jgi:ATP-dependent DNA ligase
LSPFCNNVSAALHFIRPCSPISAKSVPAGEAWLHEPKLDGYRLQILKSGRAVRLYAGTATSGPSAWRH